MKGIEVLGYRYDSTADNKCAPILLTHKMASCREHLWGCTELVDRSHVTRLTAELDGLENQIKSLSYARDKYVSEVERLQDLLEEARQQIVTLSRASRDLLEYAECGWDHFPDVAVNLRSALNQASMPEKGTPV